MRPIGWSVVAAEEGDDMGGTRKEDSELAINVVVGRPFYPVWSMGIPEMGRGKRNWAGGRKTYRKTFFFPSLKLGSLLAKLPTVDSAILVV